MHDRSNNQLRHVLISYTRLWRKMSVTNHATFSIEHSHSSVTFKNNSRCPIILLVHMNVVAYIARIWRYYRAQGVWDESPFCPTAGFRGRAAGVRFGVKAPESSRHITDIWLPNHLQFCVFSQTAWAVGKAWETPIANRRSRLRLQAYIVQSLDIIIHHDI